MIWEVLRGIVTSDTLHQLPEAMGDALARYEQTNNSPLSSILIMQGFLPVKRFIPDAELTSVVQSIQNTKPTSAFHEKQLVQVLARLQEGLRVTDASGFPNNASGNNSASVYVMAERLRI